MRKGVIDLDWLNAEIDRLSNKGANSKTEEKLDFREERTLLKVRSKCTPIEEPQKEELSKYCKVNNKEYCFLSGACKECSIESFLSKTCINDWESKEYCSMEGACEMCKLK